MSIARLPARALLVAAAACASIAPDAEAALRPGYGGAARVAFAEPLGRVRPNAHPTVPERLATRCLYETLGGTQGLARRTRAEDGGLRWIFVLWPGITFHDGTPCDAPAVEAALARALASRSPRAADDDTTEARIVSVLAVSELEVEVALASPSDDPPAILESDEFAIVSSSGAGTGPFRLERFDPRAAPGSVTLRLAAYEGHRSGRPFVDAVEFIRARDAAEEWLLFARGAADLVPEPPSPPPAPASVRSRTLAAPESSLVGARLPEPLPVFAGLLPAVIDPHAMLRFLPPGFAAARPLKGLDETSDRERVRPGAECAVSAPPGVPWLERVAERVQVDLLDAGIAARLVPEAVPGALAVIETCGERAAPGLLPLLRHARRYALSETLVGVGARGCGPDLASAWKRER